MSRRSETCARVALRDALQRNNVVNIGYGVFLFVIIVKIIVSISYPRLSDEINRRRRNGPGKISKSTLFGRLYK